MKKVFLSICALSLLLFSAATAQADVITNWNYTANVVLTNMAWTSGLDGVAGPNGGYQNLTYDTENGQESVDGYGAYHWGQSGSVNSGLTVDGSSGQIKTDGGSVAGVTVTHHNNPLTSTYKTLSSGTIFTTVALTSQDGQHSYTVGSSLDFYFLETPNDGLGYDDDIFFMTSAEIVKSLGSFEVDGVTYYVAIYTRLQALTGEFLRMAQESLGVSSDTVLYGWTTAEGETLSNAYDLSLTVSLTPPSVPIPGAVWLMGTGLAGLMAYRRKVSR